MRTVPELFAYLGVDELGDFGVVVKNARVPAGVLPLASTQAWKLERDFIRAQLENQAVISNKKIYFCRFQFDGVIWTTRNGQPWDE